LFTAFPARAHGEQLLVTFVAIAWAIPAACLIFIPWHRWWAKLAAVSALSIASAACVYWIHSINPYVFFLGPAACGCAVAGALWVFNSKQAAA
ncbi:MAG: hypothetical protein IAG10_33770, partial [Planctomycetaceae bacterium]|nr:hypothetical protein [Planctomycetaceae bacterium]